MVSLDCTPNLMKVRLFREGMTLLFPHCPSLTACFSCTRLKDYVVAESEEKKKFSVTSWDSRVIHPNAEEHCWRSSIKLDIQVYMALYSPFFGFLIIIQKS